jgi:hypothetical protein
LVTVPIDPLPINSSLILVAAIMSSAVLVSNTSSAVRVFAG